MKLAAYLDKLDPNLAARLESALEAVRQEFEDKIAHVVEHTVAAAEQEAAAQVAEATPIQAPATAPGVFDAADELRLAALDIDLATSQATILETLSRGVLRFASRVAIFVNRGPEIHGWSASGFGEADGRIKEVALGGDVPFPLAGRLNEGSIALSSEDCAPVCDALGARHASMGLLLPFVLGDQVVGTVYCDRLDKDHFSVSALQMLTYIAGQTLETLSVRKREATATLSLARGGVRSEATQQEPAPPVEASIPSAEPAVETVTPTEPAVSPEEFEALAGEEEYSPGAEAEPQTAATENIPEPEVDRSADSLYDLPPAFGEESTRPGSYIPGAPPVTEQPGPAAAIAEPTEHEELEEHPELATDMPSLETPDTVGPVDPSTPSVSSSSTQVAPPSDLDGPGWAFTSGSEASAESSEAEHEEAQRLARLLVTEIKLYNEDAVEQGRRSGDVYNRLQEDIDRSRQIFEDRIDPAVRNENDYFKQALVRILAGGDPAILGI